MLNIYCLKASYLTRTTERANRPQGRGRANELRTGYPGRGPPQTATTVRDRTSSEDGAGDALNREMHPSDNIFCTIS